MKLSATVQNLLLEISQRFNTSHFGTSNTNQSGLVLRHDLDFSLSAGLILSEAERNLGLNSQVFIRISSNSYNINSGLSGRELLTLSELQEIGIHIDPPSSFSNYQDFQSNLRISKEIIENITCKEVRIISYHRPKPEDLNGPETVEGLINMYSTSLFKDRIYISDSANSWSTEKYNKLFTDLNRTKKKQLLLHPEWWLNENGKKSFFICLQNEFEKSLIELRNENKVFSTGVSILDLLS
jgi:hypothetical protein